MYNKVILAGNLTRDIEIRYTQGGMAVASTGIASNRKFKSATGEQKEEVCFLDFNVFGRSVAKMGHWIRNWFVHCRRSGEEHCVESFYASNK